MLTRSWAVGLAALLLAGVGCGKKDATPAGQGDAAPPPPWVSSGNPPAGAKSATPFLQGSRDTPARREWNRDFVSRSGGAVVFRVSCDAPFAVTIITDKGREALVSGDKARFTKSDVLLTADGKPPSYEGRVTVPPGRAWFIIENQSDSTARMSLECYEGD